MGSGSYYCIHLTKTDENVFQVTLEVAKFSK